MRENWPYRILALLLAFACWYLVTGQDKVETWIEIPVEIVNTPKDLVVQSGVPSRINVRVRGSKPMLRGLDARSLAYSLNLATLTPGTNVVTIEPGKVSVPKAVEVIEIDPARLTVEADRLVRRRVPVEPRWQGDVAEDYELLEAVADPLVVQLEGPERLVEPLKSVPTLPLTGNVTSAGAMVRDLGLDLPREIQANPASVRVHFRFAERTRQMWLKIPIRVLPENSSAAASAQVKPATVQVQVEAPVSIAREKDFRERFSAFILLNSSMEPGWHVVEYRIKMPPGCTLIKAVPQKVDLRIRRKPA
ncbi:YbbR domain-containing protein [Desulfobaculum xiamenense]|uniref:YbbR domain-containing protein n=1 Tax=Desulfobaculum xiamenense TaxID=995050 RepID=A0A846QGV0_9BACT|nr:CdaR family protein [Desulfobaculum xiamenense]NJB67451.1 YbbR domain-containing protein [Desulfobaculum xiamenense]